MLKRIRPVMAGLLLLSLAFLTAGATWEKHPAENVLNFQFRNATRFNQVRDSSAVTLKASYAATSLSDTTESVDMRAAHYRGPYGIWYPGSMALAAGVPGSIVDTVWAWSVRVYNPQNAVVTGADSVELTVQVSTDNLNWTSIDTIGVAASIRYDLTGTLGNVKTNLFTTPRGMGTDRINWDKPACDFLRFILREDPNGTPGTPIAVSLTARK